MIKIRQEFLIKQVKGVYCEIPNRNLLIRPRRECVVGAAAFLARCLFLSVDLGRDPRVIMKPRAADVTWVTSVVFGAKLIAPH
jgi:hypothetical protein